MYHTAGAGTARGAVFSLRGGSLSSVGGEAHRSEREFFIDNLLVRIHFIIEMIWRTGLAPWEFKFHFPGSLISPFLALLG